MVCVYSLACRLELSFDELGSLTIWIRKKADVQVSDPFAVFLDVREGASSGMEFALYD